VFHENTFLAAVVRIQAERGHRVVSTGPYAVVRHPLYAVMLVFLPANALMLGSWYGVAGAMVLAGAIVFRTAMEDRELLRGLDGYAAYAARVRYRLIPFVW
jgi:protein-S-isoprenylcysteine O-methyltransferase Ste14